MYKKAKKFFKENYSYNMEKHQDLINKISEEKTYLYISEFNRSIQDLKVSTHPKTIFEIILLKLLDVNTKKETVSSEEEKEVETEVIKIKEPTKKEEVYKEETRVKKEILKETTTEDDFLPFVNIPKYKKILINNTLAKAKKKLLNDLKTKCSQLSTF